MYQREGRGRAGKCAGEAEGSVRHDERGEGGGNETGTGMGTSAMPQRGGDTDTYENAAGGRTGWDDAGCGTARGAGDPRSVGGGYPPVFAHDLALRLGGGGRSFAILHTVSALYSPHSPAYGHLHSSSIVGFVLGFEFIGRGFGPRLGGEDERSHSHSHPHPHPHSYSRSCARLRYPTASCVRGPPSTSATIQMESMAPRTEPTEWRDAFSRAAGWCDSRDSPINSYVLDTLRIEFLHHLPIYRPNSASSFYFASYILCFIPSVLIAFRHLVLTTPNVPFPISSITS
ncbi:hypothetical protein B0H13DRAFT_1880595 [Mycena leptocephala]|nr:hypothetical protein B0H13DRAFT_1880595 [Mycena leptocephala]